MLFLCHTYIVLLNVFYPHKIWNLKILSLRVTLIQYLACCTQLGVALEVEILRKISTNRLTLRLQSDLLEILKQNAHKKDLTLNAMISNILHKNIAYDETVNVLPNMIIPHDLFFSIVSKIPESEMEDIVKEGPRIVKK